MITSANIKADLDKIRYYYTRKETFDKAFDSVIKNNILDLIEMYNVAMSVAEPKLFELYVCIYIHGNTYDAAAKEMAYSKDYVTKHHRRLMKYLINYFNNEEKQEMITIKEIKKDLKEIRRYYGNTSVFEENAEIVEKVQKYNSMVCKANVRLYELYIIMYAGNNTMEKAAEIMKFSINYVCKRNAMLVQFFYEQLNKSEVA